MAAVAGLILCGGQSRRMGRSKAWLPFAGTTLLDHAVRTLSAVVDPVVVVAVPGQELPSLSTEVLLAYDAVSDRGPLEGLAAGLAALAGRAEVAFVTSCDAPFLQLALVGRLVELLGEAGVCVPRIEGRFQPLTAVYRVNLLPVVQGLLLEGRCRLLDLLDTVPIRAATDDELGNVDPDLRSFRNLNTPEDYAAALRDVASEPPVR